MTATEQPAGTSEAAGSRAPRDGGRPATSSLPPAAEAVVRRRRVESRQRRLTTFQAMASVVFVALLGALAWVGYQASLRVGGGTDSRVTDPTEPGYVAEPRPTPVDLYVLTDPEGAFASALVVVSDGSGEGGTAVPLSPSFVVPEYEGSPPLFLRDVYEQGGVDGIRERLGVALGFGIDTAETVPSTALEQLAGGAPVEIDNVDNLVARNAEGTEELLYPAGPLTIEPEQIATFLSFEGADDPAPNQALRAEAVWEELLGRAASADLGDLPVGERSEGAQSPPFAEAVPSLVAGEVTFDTVPMARVPVPDSYFVAWMPDEENLGPFVARVVPLPRSPVPGARTAVALLNGTRGADSVPAAVPVVVAAGGEVALIGNASSLDVQTTTVEYGDPAAQSVAESIASDLGVSATPAADSIEGASVRVVLGSDRAG